MRTWTCLRIRESEARRAGKDLAEDGAATLCNAAQSPIQDAQQAQAPAEWQNLPRLGPRILSPPPGLKYRGLWFRGFAANNAASPTAKSCPARQAWPELFVPAAPVESEGFSQREVVFAFDFSQAPSCRMPGIAVVIPLGHFLKATRGFMDSRNGAHADCGGRIFV